MIKTDNLDIIDTLPVEKIIKLKGYDDYWLKYDESSEILKQKYSCQEYRKEEIRCYREVISNLASFIKNNISDLDPIKICGMISGIIYKEDTWFYKEGCFKYDDDTEAYRLLDELEDLSTTTFDYNKQLEIINSKNYIKENLISANDTYYCYGMEVLRGRGCCRHLASFFDDIFKELGLECYRVSNSIYSMKKGTTSLINVLNPYLPGNLIPTRKTSKVCENNHLCIVFPYNGRFIMFDPTNILFSVVENYYSKDINDNYSYVLGIPSLRRLNDLEFDDLRLLLCRFYESNKDNISLIDIYKLFFSGAKLSLICDDEYINNHVDSYYEFMNHSSKRSIYKHENERQILTRTLSQ